MLNARQASTIMKRIESSSVSFVSDVHAMVPYAIKHFVDTGNVGYLNRTQRAIASRNVREGSYFASYVSQLTTVKWGKDKNGTPAFVPTETERKAYEIGQEFYTWLNAERVSNTSSKVNVTKYATSVMKRLRKLAEEGKADKRQLARDIAAAIEKLL